MMEIIPAIDIIGGKCVRLTQGDYAQMKVYNENPLEVARQFEDAGLKRLHLVDLDGAKNGEVKNWKTLELIAARSSLIIDFSGGISSEKNLQICFDSGAHYASIGSLAVKNEFELSKWILRFGPDRFIIAADVKSEKIVVKGWTEETDVSVYDLIHLYRSRNVNDFFCTDVSKDGLLLGTSIDLYKKIIEKFPAVRLIASGGVIDLDEVDQLEELGCAGVIIGKAIYENRVSLSDIKKRMS